MGEKDRMPEIASAGVPGTDFPAAVREVDDALIGVLGIGPTGARSRSQ